MIVFFASVVSVIRAPPPVPAWPPALGDRQHETMPYLSWTSGILPVLDGALQHAELPHGKPYPGGIRRSRRGSDQRAAGPRVRSAASSQLSSSSASMGSR